MKLPPEGARWLVLLRFWACAAVFLVTTAAWLLGVLPQPLPAVRGRGRGARVQPVFRSAARNWAGRPAERRAEHLPAGALRSRGPDVLLYFADFPRNPFLSYFVFHMIIAGMYLRGSLPYLVAAAGHGHGGSDDAPGIPGLDSPFRLAISPIRPARRGPAPLYLLTVFAALASTLWIAVYFTTAIRRYVDRAHAELRQKEKLLGIGQLVAGIAHQIANPLDGVQNCLQRIGETVRDDPHLTEYVQMMVAALDRIERTAKRVQAFALPHGITLQSTDLNAVVEATLSLLGPTRRSRVRVRTELKDVPPVQGDPVHAARGALQPLHQRLCRHAPRRNADAAHAAAGRRRRGPDGLRGRRGGRHRRGHPPRQPGEDFRALLHHPRRQRRHRDGAGAVPHADQRDGRPHRGPQRRPTRDGLHRGPQSGRRLHAVPQRAAAECHGDAIDVTSRID